MDILTTNWTEKIKTNPVANLTLNSNKANLRYVYFQQADRYDDKYGYLDYDFRNSTLEKVEKSTWGEIKTQHESEDQLKHRIQEKRIKGGQRARRRRRDGNQNEDGILPSTFYEYNPEEDQEDEVIPDYWANTYVADYINISHPKIRPCYVSALSRTPLQIKPASVFFSDV